MARKYRDVTGARREHLSPNAKAHRGVFEHMGFRCSRGVGAGESPPFRVATKVLVRGVVAVGCVALANGLQTAGCPLLQWNLDSSSGGGRQSLHRRTSSVAAS